jgi:hypothetical protein
MARPLRIEYEGAVYHIIGKGNRGEFIFSEDRDKEGRKRMVSGLDFRLNLLNLPEQSLIGGHLPF